MKINNILKILLEDKEKSELIYCFKITKEFHKVKVEILADKEIYHALKNSLTTIPGARVYDEASAAWNLPLEFVEEKYQDVIGFIVKFEESK